MKPRRVLVVDDEASFLYAVKKVLESPEMSVDTAESKSDAEALILQNDYGAVVLDLRLTGSAGEEGLEIAGLVRKRCPDTVIMLITAYGNDEVREKAGALEVDFYFEKPVSLELLREALKECWE